MTRPVRMHYYRTIWISDLHLGTRGCKAEFLLDFLRDTEAETIYLVGDIIDGWRLKKSWYWPQAHNDVIQKVLRKVRKGTRAIYVPGNHDEWLRDFTQLQFGGVEVMEDAIHVTADGRRLLVLHGDVFDAVVMHARWLALLGDGAYTATLWLNRHFNTMRRRLGYPYWSLSAYLKRRVKNAVQYITSLAKPWPTRRSAAASRVSSAATSTMPSCVRLATFFIATVVTGSRAALLWSNISTGDSKSFTGSTLGASMN